MRFEMHIHTGDSNAPVANIPAAKLVELYHEKGYDGMVFTDHFSEEAMDWLSPETQGFSHEQIIDRWLKSYRSAKEAGDRLGMKIFLGMELRFTDTINDYLVYGITEEFLKEHPPLHLLSLDELNRIKTDDMLIYQAHPFRNRMVVGAPDKLFGVEVYNGATEYKRNLTADLWSEMYGLHKISGSDCHQLPQLAKAGLDFIDEIHTYQDLINALKQDRYTLIRV